MKRSRSIKPTRHDAARAAAELQCLHDAAQSKPDKRVFCIANADRARKLVSTIRVGDASLLPAWLVAYRAYGWGDKP